MTELVKSKRATLLSRTALALIALLAVSPVLESTSAYAENDGSGAAQLRAMRKAQRSGKPARAPFKRKASEQSLHTPVATGKATTSTEIVADKAVQPFLSANAAADMAAVETHYAHIVASGGWPTVPKGTYKKGTQSSAVEALNKRLFIEGYLRAEGVQGEFASTYTSATQDAVTRFQRNMGFAVTGNVDGATLSALNVPAANRLATIRANIARVATYSQELGDRYIVVNVPAQQIQAISGGKVYSQHNAIVGRPERPTPVVMTALSDINFNPYWNAPPSIIERDIIPKIENGSTEILEKMNIKVFKGFGGPEIDPSSVDWSSAIADDYHFRQEPGGENAMATAKINFSSPFGIYLHDTPEKKLFQAGGRFFSSGCVRVDQVAILLNWILNGQDGIDATRIASLGETLDRLDVQLTSPPQLRVAYLTAWPAGGSIAAFRNDTYQLDGTGFVVGQPMPVGETSPDGQRFVLKPIPRQVAAVDAAEAEGFTWFGRKFSNKSSTAKTAPAQAESNTSVAADDSETVAPKAKTVTATTKTKQATTSGTAPKKLAKSGKGTKSKKEFKGLFDWDSYYAEQRTDGKSGKPIAAKKAANSAKTKTTVATAKKTDSTKTKATVASTKVKAADPKKTETKVANTAKTTAAKPKSADTATVKKVAADQKAVAEKPTAAAAKKPVADAAKAKKPAAAETANAKKPAAAETANAKKPAAAETAKAKKPAAVEMANAKKPAAADTAKAKKPAPAVDCTKDKTAKACVTAQALPKKKKAAEAAAN